MNTLRQITLEATQDEIAYLKFLVGNLHVGIAFEKDMSSDKVATHLEKLAGYIRTPGTGREAALLDGKDIPDEEPREFIRSAFITKDSKKLN